MRAQEDDSFPLRISHPQRQGELSIHAPGGGNLRGAVREAKSYLGIGMTKSRDEKGLQWQIDWLAPQLPLLAVFLLITVALMVELAVLRYFEVVVGWLPV